MGHRFQVILAPPLYSKFSVLPPTYVLNMVRTTDRSRTRVPYPVYSIQTLIEDNFWRPVFR